MCVFFNRLLFLGRRKTIACSSQTDVEHQQTNDHSRKQQHQAIITTCAVTQLMIQLGQAMVSTANRLTKTTQKGKRLDSFHPVTKT